MAMSAGAYLIKREGDSARWLELGAAWPHSDGKGLDVVLEVVPDVSPLSLKAKE
jgi:hypothetical protein